MFTSLRKIFGEHYFFLLSMQQHTDQHSTNPAILALNHSDYVYSTKQPFQGAISSSGTSPFVTSHTWKEFQHTCSSRCRFIKTQKANIAIYLGSSGLKAWNYEKYTSYWFTSVLVYAIFLTVLLYQLYTSYYSSPLSNRNFEEHSSLGNVHIWTKARCE